MSASHPLQRRGMLLAGLMVGTALLGQALVPTRRLADTRGGFKLAQAVPKAFGGWRIDAFARGGVVNPQTQQLLDQLYAEVLERIYVNDLGQRVMLTIAYGPDQSDPSVGLHYPEVCYPAQGFKVLSNVEGQLSLPVGTLQVRRLETNLAGQRPEPVTYWTLVGDQPTLGGMDKRLKEIEYGFKGFVVDGMLVRVSTINPDSAAAFATQDAFVRDLAAALDPVARRRLTGF